MKTFVVIEDHEIMRKGLAAHFARKKRWKLIGQAANLDEAAELFNSALPDLVLLDIKLEDRWGLDFISRLKERFGEAAPPVLVYSAYEDYVHIKASVRAGAAGFVSKSQTSQELEEAMKAVTSGSFMSRGGGGAWFLKNKRTAPHIFCC
jgi:DNA-binding NarL/FixJ family response regulator